MEIINPHIAWKKKNKTIVVYLDFNYYLFKNKAMKWMDWLLKGNKRKGRLIPKEFIEFLRRKNILYHHGRDQWI